MVLACVASTLPAAAAGTDADGPWWLHTVQTGDTLYGLRAAQLEPTADLRRLQRLNQIRDPRRLVPGSVIRVPSEWVRRQATTAEVLHAHGQVGRTRADGSVQALVGGETLAGGDVLRTGAQSSAALRFADGSVLQLRPQSRLRIVQSNRLGRADRHELQLDLSQGSVDARVPPPVGAVDPAGARRAGRSSRVEIRTPVANLGVRGTDFRAQAEPWQARLEVLEGQVAAGPREVGAGFGVIATAQGVSTPRPLLAAPGLAREPLQIGRLPLELQWAAVPGAAAYRAQVTAPGTASDRLLLDGRFEQPRAAWVDDLADGRYRLRLRAIDTDGIEGRDAETELVLKARPEPPFVTQPARAARIVREEVDFAWTRNPQAARYRLQIADQADFSAPRIDRADLEQAQFRIALPLGTHHWRLASIRADGDQGPFGDPQVFERIAPPPPPPAAPASAPPEVGDAGVLLRWAASPLAGARYRVEVASDSAFTRTLVHAQTESASYLLAEAPPGHYFVRVRTIDAGGREGPPGGAQQIEVPSRRPWWVWLLPLFVLAL